MVSGFWGIKSLREFLIFSAVRVFLSMSVAQSGRLGSRRARFLQ